MSSLQDKGAPHLPRFLKRRSGLKPGPKWTRESGSGCQKTVGKWQGWSWGHPSLPSGWWNFKAYIRQAAQGRDTLITYLICCHDPHDITYVTVAFSDYSRLWIPKSIFPDELVWIFFLALVSFSYFLSASLLRSLLVFLVSPKLPNVQELFLDCSLLVFLSPDHSDDISNRLALLLLDIYSSAFPRLDLFHCVQG